MKRILNTLFLLSLTSSIAWSIGSDSTTISGKDSIIFEVYKNLSTKELSFEAFSNAYLGYKRLLSKNAIKKKNIVSIVDFNKSSKDERFFVIDLDKKKVIHKSLVAHGKNSGWDIPTSFSNRINSLQSSLGFFLTGETYIGKHGLSLKLDGLERGINDNARKRYIVIHAAEYVSESFIAKIGRLGRSFGCPSLPIKDFTEVIDIIKDKSLIFIYSDQAEYFQKSQYL